MAEPRLALRPLPEKWQPFLKRVRTRLSQSDLVHVLDSLPSAHMMAFNKISIANEDMFRMRLGYRKQGDGSRAASWAYFRPDCCAVIPPINIRDHVPSRVGSGDHTRSFPRPAASLLRIAGELHPPFCFLQFDAHDDVANVRLMLCALIFYYLFTAGIDDYATTWRGFERSLTDALRYIASRPEYKSWGREQSDDSNVTIDADASEEEIMTGTGDNVISANTGSLLMLSNGLYSISLGRLTGVTLKDARMGIPDSQDEGTADAETDPHVSNKLPVPSIEIHPPSQEDGNQPELESIEVTENPTFEQTRKAVMDEYNTTAGKPQDNGPAENSDLPELPPTTNVPELEVPDVFTQIPRSHSHNSADPLLVQDAQRHENQDKIIPTTATSNSNNNYNNASGEEEISHPPSASPPQKTPPTQQEAPMLAALQNPHRISEIVDLCSDGADEPAALDMKAPDALPRLTGAIRVTSAQTINLCSNEEDSFSMNAPKHEVEATPEVQDVFPRRRPPTIAPADDDDELYWSGQSRGVKRKADVLDNSEKNEADDELEVVNGDAWGRASSSQLRIGTGRRG
jgi:hypothetical protein